jgi:hypothetical protein
MVDDKLVSRFFWVGDIQHVRIVPTIFYFYILLFNYLNNSSNKNLNLTLVLWQRGYCGVLLILFFIGSIPINTLLFYIMFILFNFVYKLFL